MSSVDRVCMAPLYALVGYLPVSLSCMFGTASSLNLPSSTFRESGFTALCISKVRSLVAENFDGLRNDLLLAIQGRKRDSPS